MGLLELIPIAIPLSNEAHSSVISTLSEQGAARAAQLPGYVSCGAKPVKAQTE
jgi:hypothetical protein